MSRKPAITDCGDDGCEECDACRYLGFLEWVGCVGKPEGSVVERDAEMDAYLRERYPAMFSPPPSPLPRRGEE